MTDRAPDRRLPAIRPLPSNVRPFLVAVGLLLAACAADGPVGPGSDAPQDPDNGNAVCDLDESFLFQTGVPKDGIAALNDPEWLSPDHATALWFLRDSDRVVGLEVGGRAYAVPLNLFWYHEVANTTIDTPEGAVDLAITHCPLTGTSMVFDRAPAQGAEFGVSGILFQNNLVMYDRRTEESLWPQMLTSARCGPASGTTLPLYPSIEMTWGGWHTLHPDTKVLGSPFGEGGPYDVYPYGSYEDPDRGFSFPMPVLDPRRPLKERVLGLISDALGVSVAFPFGALDELGPVGVLDWRLSITADPVAVFWDRERSTAGAFLPRVGDLELTFVEGAEEITDTQTGSTWTVQGLAVSGPLEGTRLESAGDQYIAFWGAWAAFFQETEVVSNRKPSDPTT